MKLRAKWEDVKKIASYAWGYCKAPILLWFATGKWASGALSIGRSPRIINRGKLRIGRNFRVRGIVGRALIEVGPHGELLIGDDVFINQGTVLFAGTHVEIGNRVDIGDAVRIYDTNFHPTRPGEQTKYAAVKIEDDVWIASGAVILPGVTIGRGSVVAAGAIVTKSVEPGSVVAVRPGSVVDRFEVPTDFRRRIL